MKALVIAPQPFFSPRGTPFSVYYRTLITAELGVKVDLLTYGEGQDVNIPGVRILRIPRFRMLGSARIGPSLFKLFLDGFLVVWTVALLLRNRYDFVHAHEEAVFFARFLKPLFRFKLVYDMHSSLPEQLNNFDVSKRKSLVQVFRKMEDSSLRAADAVITICPALSDYVIRLINNKQKHFLIENSIFDPIRLVERKSSRDAASKNGAPPAHITSISKGKPLVVYAGTLEHYQGIDLLLNAFNKVTSAKPNVFLLIVGGTEDQVRHYSQVAEENKVAERCIFTGRVSPDLARQYNRMATILVSPRTVGSNTPLKIYEQLASGVPLVATKVYSHTQVLDDNVAFLVEPDADDLARGILQALSSTKERCRKAENAKKLYERRYSRRVYIAKMQRLLEILG